MCLAQEERALRNKLAPFQQATHKSSQGRQTAMRTQHMLMYGLSRSPILAHFQKMPMTPSLFLSMMLGKKW